MIIDVDGQQFDVPDDATPGEIDALTKPKAPPPLGMPRSESAARGALQSFSLGWGDEGSAAIAATLPFTDREATAPGLTDLASGNAGNSWGDRYRRARDFYRRLNTQAKESNPGTYRTGEVGGVLAQIAATRGGAAPATAPQAVGLGARLLQGMKVGALTGGAYGAGASDADTAGGVAGDTAAGAGLGAAVGGLAPVVGAGLKKAAGPVAEWLQKKAVEQGRKALTGIGQPLAAHKEIPEAAVLQALDTGAVKYAGTTTGAAKRLGDQADQLGAVYGKLIDDLQAAGVSGPNAELMAREALQRATAAGQVLARAEKGEWEKLAQDLREAVPSTPFASRDLSLRQAQEIKHNLQEEAKSAYDAVARRKTPRQNALEDVAAFTRQKLEEAVAAQATKAPDQAAAFMPVKERLSNVFAALGPASEGAARAARKAPPSPVPAILATAASGSPWAGLATLMSQIGNRRIASTAARGSRAGEKLLEALGRTNLTAAQRAEAEQLAAYLAARSRPQLPAGMLPAAADEEPRP